MNRSFCVRDPQAVRRTVSRRDLNSPPNPATALSGGDLGVAGGAQRHEVRFIVRATLGQRYDVVNLLRTGDPATLLAPLAQGVGSDEAVAYPFPNPAVSLLHSRVALVAFVSLGFQPGVFLTEVTVGKSWTTGVGTGALGSAWHREYLQGHRKRRLQISLRRPVCSLLHHDHIRNSRGNQVNYSELL